jgi:hypothetical protein
LALWLAAHHPLSPPAALAGVALLAGLSLAWPARWLLWLLPILPMLGLMTWSGWLIVEEFDIAVLAVAGGAWLRRSAGWPHAGVRRRKLWKVLLLFAPLLLSTVLSGERGVAGAGGWALGWWQGYREPLNSLRLAKPLFETLLLLPLWLAACREDEVAATARWTAALQAVLVGVALWVVWERLAFTGLADFSTDYRATGPFWEMHIGGAGLDAVLALTLPGAVAALAGARSPARWALAAGVLVLGLYAALVTFSRIVYIAVPLGVAVWWALSAWRAGPQSRPQQGPGTLRAAVPWIVGFVALAAWAFPASGYRGLLALLGGVGLTLAAAPALRTLGPARWPQAAVLALPAVALAAGLAWWPKGAYVATAAAWLGGAGALWLARARPSGAAALCVPAALAAALVGVVSVGVSWGGDQAWASGLAAAAALAGAALAAAARRQPLWPDSPRWQAQLLAALAALGAVVAIFGGGAYMGQRMSASADDGQSRQAHWARSIGLLKGSDWLLGKGLGRYWVEQEQTGRDADQTGDFRLLPAAPGRDGQSVVLTSGRHDLGSAEAFALSQRVAFPAPGLAKLRLKVRTDMQVRLDSGLCTKHLLYPNRCQGQQLVVAAQPGVWQTLEMPFRGELLTPGPVYAPRLVVFTFSLGRNANRVEIDGLQLTDAAGQSLLHNGDFEQGLAHWYFSSDRYHMPFHAKNLVVHLLFEQGLLGLGAFGLLVAAALWRTAAGAARQHPLAPVLAGAIVALLTVGLVDSLLDMPRVAFLTWLLLGVALCLPRAGRVGIPSPVAGP